MKDYNIDELVGNFDFDSNKFNNINGLMLTNREIEVLALIAGGQNNVQISKSLVISLSTAKAHVHSILQI